MLIGRCIFSFISLSWNGTSQATPKMSFSQKKGRALLEANKKRVDVFFLRKTRSSVFATFARSKVAGNERVAFPAA